jgi:GT2 family glycosyltransferase
MKKIFDKISSPGESPVKSALKLGHFLLTKPGFSFLLRKLKNIASKLGVDKEHDVSFEEWLAAQEKESATTPLTIQPLISILVDDDTFSFNAKPLRHIADQPYTNWEMLIYSAPETEETILDFVSGMCGADSRIKVVTGTEEETAYKFSLLGQEAHGDYLLFVTDAGDLTRNALTEFARYINTHPDCDILYPDEVHDAHRSRPTPYFKPGWSPDAMLSRNYIGNCFLIKKELFTKVGGINRSYAHYYNYDLLLRASEQAKHIGHIPKVLYKEELRQSAHKEQKQILEAALARRGTPGEVVADSAAEGVYFIDYEVTKPGKVSIIIPTKDNVQMLKTTIDSIVELTHYRDYEIVLLNNNSTTAGFFELLKEYEYKYPFFKCITASFPFNFSKLINIGVAESSGEYILMLNNDVEILQADWLERMMGYAQLPHIGAVGVKLLFPDETIQHAGVVLGVGDGASHSFINFPKESDIYFNYIQSVNNCSAVTAACLMVRRDVYNEVNGMDEALPVEFNDVDFCLKLRKAGYYNVYIPSVELYHYESATRGHPFRSHAAWKQHEHDMSYFKNKWDSLIDNDPFYNPNLTTEHTDFRQKRRTKA